MQVWVSVNEADVVRIQKGMKVHFTVDAYPDKVFHGEVLQVRLNATLNRNRNGNVVTYTVVVTTENQDMKLLPYMTGWVKFEIESHPKRLDGAQRRLALEARARDDPPRRRGETWAAMNAAKQAEDKKTEKKAEGPRGPADSGQPNDRVKPADPPDQPPSQHLSPQIAAELKGHHETGRIWTIDGNYVRPVAIEIIATDGTMTEVRGREGAVLKEDDAIVDGVNVANP